MRFNCRRFLDSRLPVLDYANARRSVINGVSILNPEEIVGREQHYVLCRDGGRDFRTKEMDVLHGRSSYVLIASTDQTN